MFSLRTQATASRPSIDNAKYRSNGEFEHIIVAFRVFYGMYKMVSMLLTHTQKNKENVAVHAQNDKLKELRRQLEWELSQDGRQLESHAWYHGPIPRSHAELLLNQNGDFLIRDSTSGSVGNLVLSIFWKGSHLHFIITKVFFFYIF